MGDEKHIVDLPLTDAAIGDSKSHEPASNLPPSDPASGLHDLQSSHLQPKSFSSCPPELLETVFSHLPVKDRLNCSGVCTSWNKELSQTSSIWRDVILGRNGNCLDADPSLNAADFIALPRVEVIKLRPAVPIVMIEDFQKFVYRENEGEPEDIAADSVEFQIKEIPLRRLRTILIGGKKLKKIDLSAMWVAKENADAFRALWSEGSAESSLVDLRLPVGFHLSSDFLKEIATRNPELKHLTFSTPFRKITTDPHENPFADFAHLESLSLWHGIAAEGHMDLDKDCDYDSEPGERLPLALALNSLHMQLKSLELRGTLPWLDRSYPNDPYLPGHETTPQLMKALVHLSIDFPRPFASFIFEHFLYYGESLETLRLKRIVLDDEDYDDDEDEDDEDDVEEMIKEPQDLPPRLRSVYLGFTDPLLNRHKPRRGYRRIMTILQLLPNHVDVQIFSSSLSLSLLATGLFKDFIYRGDDAEAEADLDYVPMAASPILFSTLSDAKLWAHLSSVNLMIISMESWHQIRRMLGCFDRLTAFQLLIRNLPRSNVPAEIDRSATVPLRPLDSLTITSLVVNGSLCPKSLKEIVTSWSSVKRLAFQFHSCGSPDSVPVGVQEFFSAALRPFRKCDLANSLGLEEYLLTTKEYLRPKDRAKVPEITIPSFTWNRQVSLGNLKTLSLVCDVMLERGSFAIIVQATPLVEHFKGIQKDSPWQGICGLNQKDLSVISSWKRLRACYLAIDVRNEDLASPIPDWGGNRGASAPQRARREFVRLNDSDFVPNLVHDWRENLEFLQNLDIVCRALVAEMEYAFRPDLRSKEGGFVALFPLVYASLCDCGQVHFWTDAKDKSAKCLGFLEPEPAQ